MTDVSEPPPPVTPDPPKVEAVITNRYLLLKLINMVKALDDGLADAKEDIRRIRSSRSDIPDDLEDDVVSVEPNTSGTSLGFAPVEPEPESTIADDSWFKWSH